MRQDSTRRDIVWSCTASVRRAGQDEHQRHAGVFMVRTREKRSTLFLLIAILIAAFYRCFDMYEESCFANRAFTRINTRI